MDVRLQLPDGYEADDECGEPAREGLGNRGAVCRRCREWIPFARPTLSLMLCYFQSVFPTASAVNPMITVRLLDYLSLRTYSWLSRNAQNMATSHSIAQFIDQDLRSKASQATSAHL